MKKYFIFMSLICVFILSSCTTKEDTKKDSSILDQYKVKNTNVEVRDGDFVYRLVSDKKEYKEGEALKIHAELEYVGKLNKITISHAESPFYFNVEEKTRNYDIPYFMNMPLVKTTLIKGKPIKGSYYGGGAYSADDTKTYIYFMKQIGKGKPPFGYYVMTGYAEFDVESIVNGKKVNKKIKIEGQIDYKVKKGK